MKATVIYLLILQKHINSKQKTLKKNPYPLCLANNSRDFVVNNITKQD